MPERSTRSTPQEIRDASTTQLLGAVVGQSAELVKREIELARTEMKEDLKQELRMIEGLGVAALGGLLVLNLLLVAIVFAIVERTAFDGWVAALVVAVPVLALAVVAGIVGWLQRVRTPLQRTQRTVKRNLQWAKERLT